MIKIIKKREKREIFPGLINGGQTPITTSPLFAILNLYNHINAILKT
jgi:hypothetical protein